MFEISAVSSFAIGNSYQESWQIIYTIVFRIEFFLNNFETLSYLKNYDILFKITITASDSSAFAKCAFKIDVKPTGYPGHATLNKNNNDTIFKNTFFQNY